MSKAPKDNFRAQQHRFSFFHKKTAATLGDQTATFPDQTATLGNRSNFLFFGVPWNFYMHIFVTYHHVSLSITIYQYLSSFIIIYHHVSLSIIIYQYLSSFIIIYHHASLSILIGNHYYSLKLLCGSGWAWRAWCRTPQRCFFGSND